MGGDLETINRHLLDKTVYPSQNKVLRNNERGMTPLYSFIGKKDKTELRLTLNKVCKAEDTASRFLRDLISFPSV